MTRDRVASDEFPLTPEFLGQMLGVRRAALNEAAAALQRQQLIACTRGRIAILDRDGLEKRACECYRIVRSEFRRLLG